MDITVTYAGQGRTTTNVVDRALLHTDLGREEGGRGEHLNPTDTVAAALGACMMSILGLVAERDGVSLDGCAIRVEKEMGRSPTRIAALRATVRMPAHLESKLRQKYERAIQTCPVHRSLGENVEKPIEFVYPD